MSWPQEGDGILKLMCCFRSTRIALAALLFAFLWQSPLQACSTITLISSNSHFGMVHHIEAALFAQLYPRRKFVHLLAEKMHSEAPLLDPDQCLIVTIGSQALTTALKSKTPIPILSVLSRKSIFEFLLKKYERPLNNVKYPITAIYLDQPLQRQLNLLQCLLPAKERSHIGVLLGPYSIEEQSHLQNLAEKRNLKLTTIFVNQSENPAPILDDLLNEVKVVLAIPDHHIYNIQTARGILLSAFHKRVPLIGYSRTYVNNGALGAIYASIKQLSQQTANEIITIIESKNQKLPPPQYPQDFTVAVNYQVARSLGLDIPDEAALKYAMDKMELSSSKNKGTASGQ